MNKLEFVKNPVIAEFLGYSLDDSFTETELESSIINNLQKEYSIVKFLKWKDCKQLIENIKENKGK